MGLGNKGKKKDGADCREEEGAEKKKMKKKKKRQGVQDLNLGCSIYTHNFFFCPFLRTQACFLRT